MMILLSLLSDILAVLLSDVLLLLQEKDQRYAFATVVSDFLLLLYLPFSQFIIAYTWILHKPTHEC